MVKEVDNELPVFMIDALYRDCQCISSFSSTDYSTTLVVIADTIKIISPFSHK